MKILSVFGLVLLSGVLPAAAGERFGADNPTFSQYESLCRVDGKMDLVCAGSAMGAFASRENAAQEQVSCDFAAYWAVKDAKFAGRVFDVLPWQYGVEAIVAEPGVCKIN